jgi:hypothetical protein
MKSKSIALYALLTILLPVCSFAQQSNTRNWVYLKQIMNGAGPTMTGTAVSMFNSIWPMKYFALSADQAQSGTVFDARLEGSMDAINWMPLVVTSSVTGVQYQSSAQPVLYLRLRAALLGSGKTITATAIGVP